MFLKLRPGVIFLSGLGASSLKYLTFNSINCVLNWFVVDLKWFGVFPQSHDNLTGM